MGVLVIPTIVPVVVAIIVRDGLIFFTQRNPLCSSYGRMWECAGGKVNDGEAPREGLLRELVEELSITLAIAAVDAAPWRTCAIRNGDRLYQVTFFRVDIGDQVPQTLPGVGQRMVPARRCACARHGACERALPLRIGRSRDVQPSRQGVNGCPMPQPRSRPCVMGTAWATVCRMVLALSAETSARRPTLYHEPTTR